MKHVILNNNVKMPLLGFGSARLEGGECERSVREALEAGYRLIDTAQMYGNEREVGNAIQQSGIAREEIFITTKVCRPNNSYEGTKRAIERSLQELQVEYIDLFLIHEPYEEAKEMYAGMVEAYEKGIIRALGVSNFNVVLYQSFIKEVGVIPAVNQVEHHLFYQQDYLKEVMSMNGTHMQAWSPFAKGKQDLFQNETLVIIGEKYGKTAAQVALRFIVQSEISVIPKSANRERMIENMNIFDFELTDWEMEKLRALNQGKTLFGWY